MKFYSRIIPRYSDIIILGWKFKHILILVQILIVNRNSLFSIMISELLWLPRFTMLFG